VPGTFSVLFSANAPLAFSSALKQNSRMVFADLKNDFVFRRIFATHPHILRGLLNDLLERTGDRTIESLEYLPSEQLPVIPGFKLSILDVRCKDRSGALFIVEMQLVHMAGFLNRMVYNGSKAYVSQLKAGESYTKLVDVVAIAICDFELWPDTDQDKLEEPRMPMHSRFSMAEETTGNRKLLQVQYAFLELPKVPKEKPSGGAALWAWLFVNAPKLDKLPEDLPRGPMREAMELAKEASFSAIEIEAYHKVLDEIQQARDYGEEKEAKGHASGVLDGKRAAVIRLVTRLNVELSDGDRARIAACNDAATLDRWFDNALGAKTAKDVFGFE
jgi:predicted transposase/invertase (TIGR01784 family)